MEFSAAADDLCQVSLITTDRLSGIPGTVALHEGLPAPGVAGKDRARPVGRSAGDPSGAEGASLKHGERGQNARVVVRVPVDVVIAVLWIAPPTSVVTPIVPFGVTTECATRRMVFPSAKSPILLLLATTLRSMTAAAAPCNEDWMSFERPKQGSARRCGSAPWRAMLNRTNADSGIGPVSQAFRDLVISCVRYSRISQPGTL